MTTENFGKFVHLSGHGSVDHLEFQMPKGNLFADDFPEGCFKGRVVTLSACGLGRLDFIDMFIEQIGADVVIAPQNDVLTIDAGANVLAVEPEQYRFMEGEVFDDNGTIELLTLKVPLMSSTFIAREGMGAATYACPVFDGDGMFIGAVSILYDVAALMNTTLPSLTVGTAFTWFSMQLNGMEVYDTDASQIGKNTLTDPLYANYTQLLDTARRSINETSGYGTYSFVVEAGAHQTVNKEVYWTTVGTDTVHWRLYLAHAV